MAYISKRVDTYRYNDNFSKAIFVTYTSIASFLPRICVSLSYSNAAEQITWNKVVYNFSTYLSWVSR